MDRLSLIVTQIKFSQKRVIIKPLHSEQFVYKLKNYPFCHVFDATKYF